MTARAGPRMDRYPWPWAFLCGSVLTIAGCGGSQPGIYGFQPTAAPLRFSPDPPLSRPGAPEASTTAGGRTPSWTPSIEGSGPKEKPP